MKREDEVRLRHLVEAAEKAIRIVGGRSQAEFAADEVSSFAVVRLLEICGEAAKAVTPECRAAFPGVAWSSLAKTRDRLIHGYFDVDLRVVFEIVTCDLPSVIAAIGKLDI